MSTWAVSKFPKDAKTSTEGVWHPFCMCCSDCWTVHAAPTEKPSRQLTGRRPYPESLGATRGPEAFVVLLMGLLPQLRWFDGAGGRGPFLHTPASQWVCLFCPIPRISWLFPGPGSAKLSSHPTKTKASFSWLP